MNPYAAGALGGLAATLPMTLLMNGLFPHLPRNQQYPLPPREITERVLQPVAQAVNLNDRQLAGASLLAHFAYGATVGALQPRFDSRKHPVLGGSLYGLGIWAASYLGWIPAAGILPPAIRQPRQRRRLMLAAHVVWGAGTALVAQQLRGDHRKGKTDRH